MSWNDAWQLGMTVLVSLGGGSLIVFSMSSWLGKVWANRIAQEDRVKYQNQIEHEIAKLREYTDKTVFVHRVQFDTEFNAYKEIWKELCRANSQAKDIVMDFYDEAKDQEDLDNFRLMKLQELVPALQPYYETWNNYRPFVHPSIEVKLLDLHEKLLAPILKEHDIGLFQMNWKTGESGIEHLFIPIENHVNIIRDAIRERIQLMEIRE